MSGLAPTRSNLQSLARRLDRVRRGAALLRRKREALVSELFRIARPALDARERIASHADQAWGTLHLALTSRGAVELSTLGLPPRALSVDIASRVSWGVEVPDLGPRPTVLRSLALRDQDVGTPGVAAERATSEFEHLVELLLDAAPRELILERLSDQLVRTTRQVNRLEQRVGPALTAQHAAIRSTLEEREREDHVRLRFLLARRAG
jgi:V/A-type H+/Na+-transporting ATPase subunit D